MFDPDYVGLSFFASPAVLAVALATWATLALPRGRGIVVAVAAAAAAAGLGLSLLPSLPDAADGIDADHVPLAIAFLADLGFAATAAAVVAGRLLGSAAERRNRVRLTPARGGRGAAHTISRCSRPGPIP